MPSRLPSEDLTSLPPSDSSPYDILSVPTSATTEQIRSAYRKLALKWHPDKVTDPSAADAAKAKFQEIALAYAVLSDERRRKRYDATGRTEESLEDDEDPFSWADFYRAQFEAVISADAIEEVRKEYQGSEEEREAVLAAYTEAKGDMNGVFEGVMLSDVEVDEERFRSMIEEAIEKGEVEGYKKFTKETEKSKVERKKRARAEAKEAEEMAEELGVKEKLFGKAGGKGKKKESGEDALKSLIQQRQQGRADNFLADLEAKYAPKKKGKAAKRGPEDEPSEEMFERNRKKGKKDEAAEEAPTRKSKRTRA
ncbi:DnaJ-domain-containing protein [Myriangium duriaei CBS 260.36]|uniref:DnaJ-domain-containing protein n=1 Tax=Myriangium duriaei CBS 260.36 TaxID=1168546 RepID=A0A9P4J274_9PEZI|nr:DnaJ-domain-containing protein [Myriangium duriaei CBS 260.36]